MIPGSSLDALAARWAARPEPGVFAALAEALAKRGDLTAAARVVATGLSRYPGHAAGLIGQARIALRMGDRPLAIRALAELLERDPGHPLAREMAAEVAPALLSAGDPSAAPVVEAAEAVPAEEPMAEPAVAAATAPAEPPVDTYIEPMDGDEQVEPGDSGGEEVAAPPALAEPVEEDADEVEAPPIVTESLAALYHRQGHLEEALAAYAELAARDPSNDTVAAQHEAVRRELAAQRPLPFDARESAGRPVAAWLAELAAVRPAVARPAASFDAFYEAPPTPPDATADFDAFQRWLEELSR